MQNSKCVNNYISLKNHQMRNSDFMSKEDPWYELNYNQLNSNF